MNVLNTCPHCSKERVSDGDWPSCKACEPILADYPAIDQIENDCARKLFVWAFQEVQKYRCDFLQEAVWVGAGPKVKDSPRIGPDSYLTLPSWMSLRPKAMIEKENWLIEQAKAGIDSGLLRFEVNQYVERFGAFLSNQRKQALNL